MKTLTIATRGSQLALWQAEHIGERLEKLHGVKTTLLVLKTKGDIILDVPLSKVGGKGLFVKEIEEALLDGRADIAVHSMKDVPMVLPEGLILGAVPEREDPTDLFLSVQWPDLTALPKGAKVGTSSLRRQAQILAMRPDLTVESLRGNVITRMRKLQEGQFDAIIMASAGMLRLGLTAPHMQPLTPPDFLPAAGQGALGIEFKADRDDLSAMLRPLNHPATELRVAAERGFLAGLEGGCQVPIAGYAVLDPTQEDGSISPDATLYLEGLVADVTGTRIIRKTASCRMHESPSLTDLSAEQRQHMLVNQAREMGQRLAGDILNSGGKAILQELYTSANT